MTETDMLFIANMIDQYKYFPVKPTEDAVLAALYIVKTFPRSQLKDWLIVAGFQELNGFGEVAYIEIAYDFAQDGISMVMADDAYADRYRAEMDFIMMMVAYPLVDYLLYGPSFRPATFASDSMLDQLEAKGYLTPGQRQTLNSKWAVSESGGAVPGSVGNAYAGTRNPVSDFTNAQGNSTLQSHFDRHGGGFNSADDYLNEARNFLEKQPTPTTQSFVSNEGTYFRYDTATNEFGIINQYGGISTYFKPNDGVDYWIEKVVNVYAPR